MYTIMQVYQRLQKLNLTVSHQTLIKLVDNVGKDHDARVLQWRDILVQKLKRQDRQVNKIVYCYIYTLYLRKNYWVY